MSVRIDINCKSCGTVYSFYSYYIADANQNFDCPKCFAHIDDTMSEEILQAALSVKGVNHGFRKYHSEQQEPLFVVSIQGIDSPGEV